jgi:hypothetical protein
MRGFDVPNRHDYADRHNPIAHVILFTTLNSNLCIFLIYVSDFYSI